MTHQSIKNVEEQDDYQINSRNFQSNILDVPAQEKGYNTEKVGGKAKWNHSSISSQSKHSLNLQGKVIESLPKNVLVLNLCNCQLTSLDIVIENCR